MKHDSIPPPHSTLLLGWQSLRDRRSYVFIEAKFAGKCTGERMASVTREKLKAVYLDPGWGWFRCRVAACTHGPSSTLSNAGELARPLVSPYRNFPRLPIRRIFAFRGEIISRAKFRWHVPRPASPSKWNVKLCSDVTDTRPKVAGGFYRIACS